MPATNFKIILYLMDVTDFFYMAILVPQWIHKLEWLVRAHT